MASITPVRKPLRVWPGVVLAALVLIFKIGVPLVFTNATGTSFLGAAVCALLVVLWWLFFSRAPWIDRLAAPVVMIAAVFAVRPLVHASITGGAMGWLFYVLSVLTLPVALAAAALLTRRLPDGARRVSMTAAIFLACAAWALVRTGGITGDGKEDLHWRWTKTPEERLLAQARDEPTTTPAPTAPSVTPVVKPAAADATTPVAPAGAKPAAVDPVDRTPAEWPGFRGPRRDGVVRGVQIETDWTKAAPVELWRRQIGPGWSSFAVRGDLFYTQEQRGEDEVTTAYRVSNGLPVWRHRDRVRFYESNAGPGPRATPTIADGRLFTHGATGVLNALDATTGAVLWSHNTGADAGRKTTPMWGFTSSPVVVDNLVVVAASGSLVAYDASTGDLRWKADNVGGSYSSPHLVTLDGVPQVLLLGGNMAGSFRLADGTKLWQNAWPDGVPIVQPTVIDGTDVLTTNADAMGGLGVRRLHVTHAGGKWTVEERWTSRGLKPYFNDSVIHKGYAYGFDGRILSCIDLNDGERKWKGGRFGNGQVLLLADQDLLLVLSEEGELALVKAVPDQFTELARVKAIDGKTWNHPTLVRDTLIVRNGEEMAAFRLPSATRPN
jgi:outer membrane protein assembly factor BamB